MAEADPIAELGTAQYEGHGVVITHRQFQAEYGGVQQRLPVPDYEHALFFNPATGDHIIIRPMANGAYPQTGCFRHRVR